MTNCAGALKKCFPINQKSCYIFKNLKIFFGSPVKMFMVKLYVPVFFKEYNAVFSTLIQACYLFGSTCHGPSPGLTTR